MSNSLPSLKARLEQATAYEEIVRMFVTMNFEGARTGSLLSVLFSQPDVRRGLAPAKFDWVNQILVERTAQEFGLSKSLAKQIVPMGSAASRAAAERFSRHGKNREQAIDNTVKFILGAFRAMSSG